MGTIGRKIESAIKNISQEEWRNALDDICIAIDGTAGKKYPRLGNKAKMEKFAKEYETFLLQYISDGFLQASDSSLKFGGSLRNWSEVFYKTIRCNSLHGDDNFDNEIIIDINDLSVVKIDERGRITITKKHIMALLYSVIMDPVNAQETFKKKKLMVESKGKKMKLDLMWGNQRMVERFTGFKKTIDSLD